MSLTQSTLAAIQKAGSAAFVADTKLKHAVKEYAGRVNKSMLENPFHLGNDTLFQNWKIVARLSQTLSLIEEELRKAYQSASGLIDDDQSNLMQVPALAAPTLAAGGRAIAQADMAPTDVVAKPKRNIRSRRTSARKAGQSKTRVAGVPGERLGLKGNPAKLMEYLERELSVSEFTSIHQTSVANKIGIPIGSIGAALKKLVELGRVVADQEGKVKLAISPAALAQ